VAEPHDKSVRAFYDGLAAGYDALFDDWWTAARRHGHVIDGVLRAVGVVPGERVLDCACGIGTQAIPLAWRGYEVTGTDISAEAVARARREAAARAIDLQLAVADMRALDDAVSGPFDAVIACDNAIPHLLDDAELDAALRSIARVLADGGVFLASVRDYDVLAAQRPAGLPGVLRERPGGREIVGQAWEWHEEHDRVRIHLFVLREQRSGTWAAEVHTTWYRVLTRAKLDAALARTGYVDVEWHEPDESGYYQPIVTARAGR